ncbi:hypothetical protein AA13595_2406 [Gluconacetobacter johannae DSM 13595]|uniref:CsbD family protein n=1 Tax=Gluconacetobacter johannae TaxID=112140 RepID=A0A7W4J5Y7_9PROT|nr:CsbD family protein [Gluconacetobacter johannae]MBB2175340.1 CsbD family protein [Gluconacetobacter johannae]GBQ88491.1 hypothetical protein AA13595_2406 [Gluconacetobacter johannae DSM 13595]
MVESENFEAKLEDGIGRVQDGLGGLFGDPELQLKGKARIVCAKSRRCCAEVGDTVRDLTVDQPLLALAVASVIGFLAALLWSRR